ncbi:hypothetical protein CPB85DRAFT_1376752 [Mucidula mucida]|nr:hypothetical protein CPB85DRAFT_1376752 [Mucidula mucida]
MSPIPPEWRPDETDEEIFAEHTWLQGAFLGAVAYGIQAILYFMLMHKLLTARKGANTRRNTGLIIYITTIFILGTLYVAGLFEFTQQSFIDGRNIPGGPNVYEEIMFSIPIDMLANVGMVLLSWMCDVINVWRCYVVYLGGHVPALAVIAVPVMIYLASVVLGILFLKQVGHTSQSPWDSSGVNYTIPYYSTSLALNILVTLLIAVRLAYYRNRISRIMGGAQGRQYTSLAAIVIESAAIYSTFSLLFLVPFAFGHPLAQLFLQALSPIQVCSYNLIFTSLAEAVFADRFNITHSVPSRSRESVDQGDIQSGDSDDGDVRRLE